MTSNFDKSDERLREQYEEAFFQELMEGYDEYQGAKLKREAETKNMEEPSAELIAQMEAKIAEEFGRQKRRKAFTNIQRFGKYAAIFFVVIAAVFSVSFVTVDAFRTRILNFFSEDQGESTIHMIQESQSGVFSPAYIPENMNISLYNDDGEPVEILIQTANSIYYAHIFIFDGRTAVHSDTENVNTLEYIDINGVDAEYSEKDGYSSLVWSNEAQTYLIYIDSNLSREEIIKIARSINI